MVRAILRTSAGLVSGLLIGLLGPFILIAGAVDYDRPGWLELLTAEALAAFSTAAGFGALNGVVGVVDGLRSGRCRALPPLLVPLLLLAFPLIAFVAAPSDSKFGGVVLIVAVCFGLPTWVAGRIGQEIGVSGNHRRQWQPSRSEDE